MLLPSGSNRPTTTPFVARGWERAAHNSVHPCPWNSRTTLKHRQRSFGTTLSEVLPLFCVQQLGEGPEQGLPHQLIPLPCCCFYTVHSDFLQNLIQLSMIWNSMNQTSSKTLNRLLREVWIPFLEIFKDRLDGALSNLF